MPAPAISAHTTASSSPLRLGAFGQNFEKTGESAFRRVALNLQSAGTMHRICIACAMVAAIACNKNDADRKNGESAATPVAADNTKKNERDRGSTALTADDQPENEADRSITQEVRQGVVKQDSLSMAAKNVKIITQHGVVTLRGPVKSVDEKDAIGRIAQTTSGVARVENQLEIAAN